MPTSSPNIGICLWSVPGNSDESRIRLAHRLGMRGLQIDLGPSDRNYPLALPAVQDRYKEWSNSLCLTYTALGIIDFLSCSLSDPAHHRKAFETIDKAIEAAVTMEIPLLQFPSFGASAIADARGFGATVECFRYACQQAGERHILVGSENVLDRANQRLLIEMVGAPNFRIYFDTANPKRMKDLSGPELLEDVFDLTPEVHLKDSFLSGVPALLGKGETDCTQSMKILREREFSGWMHLENNYGKLSELSGVSAEELIRQDLSTVREFFSEGSLVQQ